MACWDIVGKAVGRPVYELLGGRVHERLRAYTYLYTEPDDAADVYTDPDLAAERAAALRRAGLHRAQVRPARARTRRSTRASRPRGARPHRGLRRACARGGRRPLRPALRHPRPVHRRRARFGSRGGSSASTRSGSRSRCRRRCPEQMATVARATSIPIATGERLTTKYEFARVLADRRGRDPAAEPRTRRRPPRGEEDRRRWPRRTTRRSRRISTAGRWWVRRTSSSPPAARTSSCSKASGDWGGFHAEILRRPDRAGRTAT